LLIAFDDTIATSLTGDSADSPIVSEAAGFDTVASECRTDVSDRTSRKASDASSG
jgi:hypothetical protein